MPNLDQHQNLTVAQECRELVDAWQDYRYHSREMNKAWTRVRHICARHLVDLRKPIVFALFLLAILSAAGAPPGVMRTNVVLQWQYPTNELSTNLVFKLYSTTNIALPLTNWPVIATIAGTNLAVTLPIDANQRWFVMTASNWFGESLFSTVAGIPSPPRSDVKLGIGP